MKASKSRNERDGTAPASAPSHARLRLAIRGAVQGVGFRPFVYRVANELKLNGWVSNSAQGVELEVEGARAELEGFLLRLETEKPPHSFIQSLEPFWLDGNGYDRFEIRASEAGGQKTAIVLPDIATCPDCLREILDPSNRRYRYPFTNCTNCGPRFSIIERLPYDRPNTSMKSFRMCAACQAEYDDPRDRRFHAQPNACPACGPHLEMWNASGGIIARDYEALTIAADGIARGQIVAVKGIGGFHLMVDARNEQAVRKLRERKHREEKPLALMFSSLDTARSACELTPTEERALRSAEAPIVLLRRADCENSEVANSVAPGNPYLGVMLPYSPLHHLLITKLGFPVVATSGNLTDEPICTDEYEAPGRLRGIADIFLIHNRPIVRHVDDSILRIMVDREMVIRRARGYAPLPVMLPKTGGLTARLASQPNLSVLAVGAHLKNTVALSVGERVFLSQHIGDLETEQAHWAFQRTLEDFQNMYEARPQLIAADLHPDYLSTRHAHTLSGGEVEFTGVQHHIAHVLSCMAENEVSGPALGVAWDGTGYGPDGTIWGGEFFLVTDQESRRVAHFDLFRLPGGAKAVKEPRRAALGVLYKAHGDTAFERTATSPLASFSKAEFSNLKNMLARGLNSPLTSSAGRLFDAVASLVNLRQKVSFEGQAAMELEFLLHGTQEDRAYAIPLRERTAEDLLILDWRPMITEILADIESEMNTGLISARFHNGLVEGIVAVAKKCREERVVLSGGCFQNRYLCERSVTRLREEGFRPYWHQRIPPNDGGIALGQIVAALRKKG